MAVETKVIRVGTTKGTAGQLGGFNGVSPPLGMGGWIGSVREWLFSVLEWVSTKTTGFQDWGNSLIHYYKEGWPP